MHRRRERPAHPARQLGIAWGMRRISRKTSRAENQPSSFSFGAQQRSTPGNPIPDARHLRVVCLTGTGPSGGGVPIQSGFRPYRLSGPSPPCRQFEIVAKFSPDSSSLTIGAYDVVWPERTKATGRMGHRKTVLRVAGKGWPRALPALRFSVQVPLASVRSPISGRMMGDMSTFLGGRLGYQTT